MKGSYVLTIRLDKDTEIRVGKMGSINFTKGFYHYVGSALNGIEKRVERHMRNGKKLHWHIDYLLEKARVTDVLMIEGEKRLECEISAKLSEKMESVKGFGCSDCRCESHLFIRAPVSNCNCQK